MHLLQVGAGSGGIVVLDLIARDPRVSRVTLIEPDVYQAHNVYRHLFPQSAVGQPKGELAVEWLRERRPELAVDVLPVDLTANEQQPAIEQAVSSCDVGSCAADNEPAKYHFDQLMRKYRKPWVLGEVLSGGIGGWVHRFTPDGPCYGCVASYLQRTAPGDPAAPAPDYSDPSGAVRETTIPAPKASIDAIASLHAMLALDLLLLPSTVGGEESLARVESVASQEASPLTPHPPPPREEGDRAAFTSLLFTLKRVPDVFDDPFRTYKFTIPRSLACLVCSAGTGPVAENLDAALNQALARLGDD